MSMDFYVKSAALAFQANLTTKPEMSVCLFVPYLLRRLQAGCHNLRFMIRTLQSYSSASFISGYEKIAFHGFRTTRALNWNISYF